MEAERRWAECEMAHGHHQRADAARSAWSALQQARNTHLDAKRSSAKSPMSARVPLSQLLFENNTAVATHEPASGRTTRRRAIRVLGYPVIERHRAGPWTLTDTERAARAPSASSSRIYDTQERNLLSQLRPWETPLEPDWVRDDGPRSVGYSHGRSFMARVGIDTPRQHTLAASPRERMRTSQMSSAGLRSMKRRASSHTPASWQGHTAWARTHRSSQVRSQEHRYRYVERDHERVRV